MHTSCNALHVPQKYINLLMCVWQEADKRRLVASCYSLGLRWATLSAVLCQQLYIHTIRFHVSCRLSILTDIHTNCYTIHPTLKSRNTP